jgi:hypothetical protein
MEFVLIDLFAVSRASSFHAIRAQPPKSGDVERYSAAIGVTSPTASRSSEAGTNSSLADSSRV